MEEQIIETKKKAAQQVNISLKKKCLNKIFIIFFIFKRTAVICLFIFGKIFFFFQPPKRLAFLHIFLCAERVRSWFIYFVLMCVCVLLLFIIDVIQNGRGLCRQSLCD